MIYKYDDAICDDLRKSFNPEEVPNPVVSVIGPDNLVNIAAQLQNDEIHFPIVTVYRKSNTQIDTDRANFTRLHKGVQAVIDHETNNLYYERALPITLSYELTALTTNTADMDEILREIMFKYTDMYYLTIRLPYEADRKIRFGVSIDQNAGIERQSGTSEYWDSGSLYQSTITLNCEGCVLVNYVPQHLKRVDYEVTAVAKGQEQYL